MTINATITYRHFTVAWWYLTNEKEVEKNGVERQYTENKHTELNKQNIIVHNLKQIQYF